MLKTIDTLIRSRRDMLQKYFLCFAIYSILGWIYETILEVIVFQEGYTNRGILFGPMCPIYGVGAITILLFYNIFAKQKIDELPKQIKLFTSFIMCMVISTIIELTTSYLLEWTTGDWLWTYKDYAFNFQGRISLLASIVFGLGGTLFLYVLQPLLENRLNKVDKSFLEKSTLIMALLFCIDCIFTYYNIFF